MKKETPKKEKTAKIKKSDNVYTALLDFQSEAIVISRDGLGKTKDNGSYHYSTLDNVINTVRPILLKYGLGFTQTIVGTDLVTTLFHAESGTNITSSIPVGKPNEMQDMGARITYARRYSLTAILGLSTEEDTDATSVTESIFGGSVSMPDPKMPTDTVMLGTSDVGYRAVEVPAKQDIALSEAFTAAKERIAGTKTTDALNFLLEKINGSTKLEDFEKETLNVMGNERLMDITK